MTPLVSVIIPAYNSGLYISEALKSVVNQTYSNIEIIVVNDGSTDNSEEKIRAFKDTRIKYFRQENRGQCFAANLGLSYSKGDFIKFFDADDIMNPEHLSENLKALENDENAVSSCAWGRFFEDDISCAKFIYEPYCQNMEPLQWIKTTMSAKYDMMPAWFWLIPRKVIQNSGGWDEKLTLNNDFEFSIRLLLNASYVYFAPNAKLFYRSGKQSSLSLTNSEKAYRSAILSARMGCSYLLKKEDSKEMRLLCANKYSFWLYNFYPNYPHLIKELEHEIKLLGGSDRKIDESFLMHKLQSIFGWKAARLIKYYLK